jgi:multicomponent Na+:H+ antiporter subunit G
MNPIELFSLIMLILGAVFFLAGTAGLLRFPDVYARLHALTKADNLGLGLIALGIAFQLSNPWDVVKLVLVWLLAVLAAASVAQLIARAALDRPPGEAEGDEPR